MCTAEGFVVFLAVRPRAPFITTVWLLPFQHTPALTTGSHLTCKGTGPSEVPKALKGWSPVQLGAACWQCQLNQDALSNKPYSDICPALVMNLKHLLSLSSLS